MAFPDLNTLIAVAATSNLLVASFMALMHRAKPAGGQFQLVAAGALCAMAGWGAYALRFAGIGDDALLYVVGNALLLAYPLLLAAAIRRHAGLRGHRRWSRLLVGLAIVAVLALIAVADAGRSARMLMASALNVALYALPLVLLVRHGRPWDASRAVIALVLALTVLVIAARGVAALVVGVEAAEGLPGASLVPPLLMLVSLVVALALPVAEFQRDERRMAELAELDPLTGLPNRRQALRGMKARINAPRQRPFAVVFIDLDGFKRVNDSLGHAFGDELLVGIAQRLRPGLAEGELLARLGGDEFLMLLALSADEPIEARVERMLETLAPAFDVAGRQVFIGASAGISLYPEDARSGRDLVRHADTAMYRAKAAGRGRARRYTADLGAAAMADVDMEGLLRHALAHGGLRVEYQARTALAAMAVDGAEALVRLVRPDGSVVAPDQFVAVAERTGLIHELGREVLRQACHEAAAWRRQQPGMQVSVNLSPVQLRDMRLLSVLRQALAESGLPAEALELELTETALVEDPELVAQQMAELRALGVRLALDDFGMGYSSLSHLLRFPIDTLKIDRHFVSRMTSEADAETLVVTLVELARRLRMRVVAEGVETPEVLERLRALHCDEAQGYLLGRPMPAEAFRAAFLAGN